jgi:IclR family transcriptional regulator, acetate operon repressor
MKSAERTMDLLELLSRQPRPLTAMTIARRCSIPKSSTYNLLNALRARGFVTYDGTERGWQIGERVRQLGTSAATIRDAVAVLDAFRGAEHLEATELARRTGLHVVVVLRALEALADEGLVRLQDDGRCSLGVRVASLSARLGPLDELRLVARPVLIGLRDATGETANVLVKDDDHAVYLDQVESAHALRHAGWVGRSVPLDVSAAGAAFHDGAHPHVVSDAVELGVTAVASRIGAELPEPAAVSVTGPSARLRALAVDGARDAVIAAAARIAEELARLHTARQSAGAGR